MSINEAPWSWRFGARCPFELLPHASMCTISTRAYVPCAALRVFTCFVFLASYMRLSLSGPSTGLSTGNVMEIEIEGAANRAGEGQLHWAMGLNISAATPSTWRRRRFFSFQYKQALRKNTSICFLRKAADHPPKARSVILLFCLEVWCSTYRSGCSNPACKVQ